jgi:hypothetical protein
MPFFYTAEEDGFYGNTRHIVTYNPYKIRNVLVPILSPDLSACSNINMWLYHICKQFAE